MEITYIPKWGKCQTCKYGNSDCSGLVFSEMPVIKKESQGEIKVVTCTDYKVFK